MNFIDKSKFNGDVKLNDYMNIFLPTKEDVIEYEEL